MAVDARAADQRGPQGESGRLGVITDALPVGIAYVDQHKIYRFANQRFAAAYGLSPEEILGKHADEFIWRDAMELGDPFFEAAHHGQAVDFTHPAPHADGRLLTVRTFLRPDVGADGAVHGFYVCSINVTKQKEAEAALLQSQKMDAVGQLASGIAHDFNNLLAIILGNLLPLREAGAPAALIEEYVEPAIRAAEQGARLTGQLLAIARRQPLRPEPVDVERCLTDFIELLRRTLTPGVTVDLVTAGDPRPAQLDRGQFETALLNLCLNARDAMLDGGRIRIAVDYPTPTPEGGFVRVVVEDDGVGMDPRTAAQVFEPFFTTKPVGKGTGLGLAMVWGFVRQSQGTITLETAPGAGARFTLLLPLAAQRMPPEEPPPPQEGTGRGLILLVDDNHDLRRTIRRLLARAGYAVIEAAEAEEALALVPALPDLRALVSDVVMPGLSGFALARKATRLRPGLGVVLMSGFDGASAQDREGASFLLLRKPFEPQELVRAIEAVSPPVEDKRPA